MVGHLRQQFAKSDSKKAKTRAIHLCQQTSMGQHTIEEHKLKENHCNVERLEQEENPQDNAGLLSFAFFWLEC